ncbi:hypothetical protein BJ138DRAFT_1143894 [Hygrophoropsis aurantiaca]|uniref:Uncharacterized protein n=1 Tax=Hygrophoropsis aurantiaca TaxID=72124 RepID=A0ACB8ALT7_9AGAM|nr:hypothetical protein BJ138DRAFT_1143894 [Hygrophoropsis aurantiaca]
MNSVNTPPYSSPELSLPPAPFEAEQKRNMMAAWHMLDQAPPPTLREILGAYKSKGDGDRDLLLAMLKAKTSEDQRVASTADLHRTLLEMSSSSHKQMTPLPLPHPPLPAVYPLYSKHSRQNSEASNGRISPHSIPIVREAPVLSQPPRKRQRSSRSPPSSHHEARAPHPSSRDLPPSPYSSSRSDSEEYSPRSRASMAIGSLLSTGPSRDVAPEESPNNPDSIHHSHPPSAIGVSL